MVSPIIIALDYPHLTQALSFVNQLNHQSCAVKVGKELFTQAGPELVRQLVSLNFNVFLDLKFHDIPSTTSKAVVAAAHLGVWMINVHALGGMNMMKACRQALDDLCLANPPLLIAVTVLTSMNQSDLKSIGVPDPIENQVLRLAQLAQQSGMDGVVCSAQEVSKIKAACGDSFLTITPGIRSLKSDHADQSRVMTPVEALKQGSDYLVIGREVTQSNNPQETLSALLTNIQPHTTSKSYDS